MVGKVPAGVPTRCARRTSPAIERSKRDSVRHHPFNGDRLGGMSVRPSALERPFGSV